MLEVNDEHDENDTAGNAPAPAPVNDTVMSFNIEGYHQPITVDLQAIPLPVRMRLLRNAVKAYINNRTSTYQAKTKKANAAFDQYDAATRNDPLQSLVPKPLGERVEADYTPVIETAIKALYSGELGKRGTGEAKPKVTRDPVVTQITRAVVAEVYAKKFAADNSYKYPTARKEVGTDGLAYLRARIDAQVAALPESERAAKKAAFEKVLDTRYIQTARIQLGLDTPKSLKDIDSIL